MTDARYAVDGEAGAPAGNGLERVRAIWSRRKWLAIPVFALPFAAAASLIFSLPALYRSTATVLVERQQVPEAFVRATVTSELETRLHTISQEILSRSRLEALIARFGLYPDLRKQQTTEEVVDRMRRDISLEVKSTETKGQRSATVAFALSYRGRDPQTVALVTNTLASFYIEENLKARERQASGTTEFLRAQLNETKKRLDEQEHRVSEFRRRYLGELPQQMQANLATLEALNTQLRLNNDNQVRAVERRDALRAQIAEAEALAQALGAQAAAAVPGGLAPAPEPAAVHLARLKQELITAQTRYTDAHPTVVRLKQEITSVERELAGSKVEGKEPATASATPAPRGATPPSPYVLRLREALLAAEGEIKILKAEDQRLRGAIAGYQSRVENTPKREQEFLDVSRDYDSTRELHQSLVKRYEEAQLAESMEQRQKGEQFRVLDPAVPSAVTVAPNRMRLLLTLLALSAGLAVGAAMLAEMLDTSFHAPTDLRSFTRVPILVSIPRIVTVADSRRRRRRLQLATAGVVLGLALLAGASYYAGRGNEQLVRMIDRGGA